MPGEKTTPIGPGCSVQEKADRYYIRFWEEREAGRSSGQGRRRSRSFSLRTTDQATAFERARRYWRRYADGQFDPFRETIHATTFEQARGRYEAAKEGSLRPRSLKDILWVVKNFAEKAGLTYLDEVTAGDVHAYVYRLDLAQASRRSYHRKLNVFFRWCAKAGLLQENPAGTVERPKDYKPLPRGLQESELERLLAAVEHHVATDPDFRRRFLNELWARDAFELMATTGLRPAELPRLTWGDITFPTDRSFGQGEADAGDVMSPIRPGSLLVRSGKGRRTKNDRDRLVTMLPRAERVLRQLEEATQLTKNPSELVLKNADLTGGISPGYLSKRFLYFRKKAKLPEQFDLYSLRHTFATEYMRRGGSIYHLKEEMGHRSIETTMKYIHVTADERMRLSRRLFE